MSYLNPLDHPIVWATPRRLTHVLSWHEHIPFAMYLVDILRPQLIVELGTHYGDSYCAFCQVVRNLSLSTKCYAIDTWRGDSHSGFYGEEVLADLRRHHDPLYRDFSQLLQCTFDKAALEFKEASIDLLHIDGHHTYQAVKHDFDTWLPKLSDKSIVLLHDIDVRERNFGVWQLWEELRLSYPHFEFLHGYGLGVLGVGSALPEAVKALFNASGEEIERTRSFFHVLGRKCELENQMARADDPIRLGRTISELLDRIGKRAEVLKSPTRPSTGPLFPGYRSDAQKDIGAYHGWLQHQTTPQNSKDNGFREIGVGAYEIPLISVVIPVYRPDLAFFEKCVESVRSQTFAHWQLCLTDDGSNDPELTLFLKRLEESDPRVRVRHNTVNKGISAATNDALDVAQGEFIAFMDQDDEIEPNALEELAEIIAQNPSTDILYTDEDKIDEHGHRYEPFLKPDWAPDYLLSVMYVGHLSVIRKSLIEEVGRLRSEFDGSQDYDLILRVTERSQSIIHLPKILYHWRTIEGSAASDEMAKPWAHAAGQKALQDALGRREEDAVAEVGYFPWALRVRRRIRSNPLVSVIIPFRDGADLLRHCVDSIHSFAGYDRWEVLLVDNQSWEPETKALLDKLGGDPKCRLFSYPGEFNWSSINNWAAEKAEGDVFLFLNNDIEGVSEGWLAAMLEHAQRPEVGVVGARLLYPSGHIQHAGVIIGLGGIAGHAFRYCPPDQHSYFGMDRLIRNYSAVTGACMMVGRAVFREVGGFDEIFSVAYNDIDFCLRVRELGYSIVYTPYAELIHYESVSRGVANDLPEIRKMVERWLELIKRGDPYYNPNLSLRREDFGFPYESEMAPWKDFLSALESL